VINPVSLISLVLLNAPMHTLAERDVLLRLEQFRNYLKQNRYDERMQERWVKVCDKQDALLKYFSNNILHTFILAALTAHILKAQSENSQNLTVDDLSGQIIQAYPEVKKQFFLKWTEAELLAQINNVLEYFESERLIDLQEQRFLSAFAHLYELNLQKD